MTPGKAEHMRGKASAQLCQDATQSSVGEDLQGLTLMRRSVFFAPRVALRFRNPLGIAAACCLAFPLLETASLGAITGDSARARAMP